MRKTDISSVIQNMQRDIKFRGKSKNTGKWIISKTFVTVSEKIMMGGVEQTRWKFNLFEEIDQNTFGQFTGLYDKHGQEIYEGDLIKFENILKVVYFEEKTAQFKSIFVEFCNRQNLHGYSSSMDKEYTCGYYEKIGNIFDNSDILKRLL